MAMDGENDDWTGRLRRPSRLLLAGERGRGPADASSTTDIQRLQDQVYQAGGMCPGFDRAIPSLASRLEAELDDLRDEVMYLKVKLRKEGSVNRTEYADMRDRVQDLRIARPRRDDVGRARRLQPRWRPSGPASQAAPAAVGQRVRRERRRLDDARRRRSPAERRTIIPDGTEIDVRLQNELSSTPRRSRIGSRRRRWLISTSGNDVSIPAGSILRGVVQLREPRVAHRSKGRLTVAFDEITVRGRRYPMRGTVTAGARERRHQGRSRPHRRRLGVGGIIGGIIGGVKGALLGVLIGGGGTIAATEGKDVKLPPGTILRVRLDSTAELEMRQSVIASR